MNIIKRLTAMTSLAVCLGVITPTTIAFAKTGSTNDSHANKSKDPKQSQAIGLQQTHRLFNQTARRST
ncbi:hypothetical protein NBRC111894_3243 [Sporolactobacillus inulinus]|uniref:Uncharacterized protein n=1 Tax=Sporolactobacillus inulinus TaxID=2078 RepID=A0A4Y1ZF88_9BACL|nr:hypothetical protein [Sporolactobacillus inulinus]GAY77689.1 hypothetical protein NBRC111894_3243 [Sporolactobacillus inulinus]